ncbi:MAG: hypothetical protein ABI333_21720 [bacterium]
MLSILRGNLALLAAACLPMLLSGCERENGSGCPSGLTECDGECVNLLTNTQFCSASGTCGTGCAAGEMCNGAGTCAMFCWSGLTECDGQCVNLLTDNRFCSDSSACGTGCAAGEVCDGAGVCALSCQSGLTECDGQCVDTEHDPANCGGCDDGFGSNTCAAGSTACVGGQCEALSYVLPTAVIDVSLGINSVLVDQNLAYIIEGTQFKVLDVSDPLSSSLLGTITHGYTDVRVEAHVIRDNIVWCIRSSSGGFGQATHVFGVDVSNPANPVLRGTLTLKATTSLLANASTLYAGYWLVHDYSDNLIYVIDISNPDAPVKFSEWGVPNMVNAGPAPMMVDGGYLYLPCRENYTLRIYNLANLAAVVEVGSVGVSNDSSGPPVKLGSYVYTVDGAQLLAIDVSNPAAPSIVGSAAVSPGYLKAKNGKLFLFEYSTPTVHAYSSADPAAPVLEASSTLPIPAPSTTLQLWSLCWHASSWVGNYLVGMTYGSENQYNGVRALNFTVN